VTSHADRCLKRSRRRPPVSDGTSLLFDLPGFRVVSCEEISPGARRVVVMLVADEHRCPRSGCWPAADRMTWRESRGSPTCRWGTGRWSNAQSRERHNRRRIIGAIGRAGARRPRATVGAVNVARNPLPRPRHGGCQPTTKSNRASTCLSRVNVRSQVVLVPEQSPCQPRKTLWSVPDESAMASSVRWAWSGC
jgi:hypothetical protein